MEDQIHFINKASSAVDFKNVENRILRETTHRVGGPEIKNFSTHVEMLSIGN